MSFKSPTLKWYAVEACVQGLGMNCTVVDLGVTLHLSFITQALD